MARMPWFQMAAGMSFMMALGCNTPGAGYPTGTPSAPFPKPPATQASRTPPAPTMPAINGDPNKLLIGQPTGQGGANPGARIAPLDPSSPQTSNSNNPSPIRSFSAAEFNDANPRPPLSAANAMPAPPLSQLPNMMPTSGTTYAPATFTPPPFPPQAPLSPPPFPQQSNPAANFPTSATPSAPTFNNPGLPRATVYQSP